MTAIGERVGELISAGNDIGILLIVGCDGNEVKVIAWWMPALGPREYTRIAGWHIFHKRIA